MKNLLLLFILGVITCLACNTTNGVTENNDNIQSISLRQATRGFQKEVVITPSSIVTTHNSETTTFNLDESKNEWTTLIQTLAGVDLKNMGSLESPTNERAGDGALIGILKVVTKDQTHQHQFDNLHPHEQLQSLVDKIVAICKVNSVDFP